MSRLIDPSGGKRTWVLLGVLIISSVAAQLAFRAILPSQASLAGANGLSAALGLANGHGMTIAVSEGMAIKRTLPTDRDIETVYAPEESRLPLIEPLPGSVLLFYLISLTGLPFTLDLITLLNMFILASGAALLGRELMFRDVRIGILTGLALGFFAPMFRMTVVAGYDMYEFLFLVAAVLALLAFQRTGKPWLIAANAVLVGLGLWMRSYFFLYAAGHGLLVGWILYRRGNLMRHAALWVVPVVVLALAMISVRDSGSTGTLLTRGAFWHMFWMGVGQFENDEMTGFTDWDSCELAKRLGHPTPCDSSYEDDAQSYLFQYEIGYNERLREHASGWIPSNLGRLTANTFGRIVWMAVPALTDSSRLASRPVLKALLLILSSVLLILAIGGVIHVGRRFPEVTAILLVTYACLLPLTPYYLNAKVIAIPYFCVLAMASGGLSAVIDRVAARRGARLAP